MVGADSGGGSRALAELIETHGSSIVADLKHYFQTDVALTVSGEGETPRRVLAYIAHMPNGSATQASVREEPDAFGWDTQTYLLAGLVDAVRENTFVTAQTNTKKKIKPPEPIDVPGRVKQGKPNNLFTQMAAAQYNAAQKG